MALSRGSTPVFSVHNATWLMGDADGASAYCAQAMLGIQATMMPGSRLGAGAVLGAIALADAGQGLAGGMLHMGAPAVALSMHDAGPIITPLGAAQHALFRAMPALQAAVILVEQAATVLAAGFAAVGLLAAAVRSASSKVTPESHYCLQHFHTLSVRMLPSRTVHLRYV